MAGSNLYMNWTAVSVTYTPPGASQVVKTITEVLEVEPDAETQQEMFFGDARKFPRLIVPTTRERSMSITSGDAAALLGIPENVPCTVTATLLDAASQSAAAGSGSIQLTLTNAMRKSVKPKAANNKFAGTTIHFEAYGDANDDDPMAIVQL